MSNHKQTIILSLGGSLIHPKKGINISFLRKFNQLVRKQVKKGKRFFIVCGGGTISRIYQNAARQVVEKISDRDVDWLGIHGTKMNAQLLRIVFADLTIPRIIFKYRELREDIKKPVVVCAGGEPGCSTDYDAVFLAQKYQTKTLINLSNIDVLYDKDPQKYPDARPIEKISWDNLLKLVGEKWVPGANVPFDPLAIKLAKKNNLSVFVVGGNNLSNLERLLEEKPFKGTIIMPFKLDTSFYDRDYFELGVGYKGYTTTVSGKLIAHLTNFYRALLIKLFLRPKTLLDVGCATGLLVFYLRKMGVSTCGVEISQYALSKAYPSIKKYLSFGNILKLPFKDRSFDVVTTFNVLEHLEKGKILQALRESNRVCRKFHLHKIYTTENKWMGRFHEGDLSQVSVYPKSFWEELFLKRGFKKANIFFPRLPKFMETIFILNRNASFKP